MRVLIDDAMRRTTPILFLLGSLTTGIVHGQVPNDACIDAITITCGTSATGSTTEATLDPGAFTCGTSVSSAGVWYSIVGTGDAITLSTCQDLAYDTKINVYTGSCEDLVCVTGNDDGGDCDVGSTASFPSEPGTTYLVLVQGYNGFTGDFELSATCGPVGYDYCQGATPIGCNQSLPGSTMQATPDAIPFFCETGIQAPGVWYSFTGTGDPVVISTCESSDFDTRLNVYTGTCGALECVTGNDDTPEVGLCSTANFLAAEGTTYLILVQGYDGATGTFQLELACQACGTPSEVSATASDTAAFVFWSSFNPGATYVIEHGPLGFQPGTGVESTGVVNGTNASAVIPGLESGTEYAFYVQEFCGPGEVSQRIGPYTFITLEQEPAANAICSGALPLTCGESLEGNTAESFHLPLPTCGAANVTAPGLWYSITGTGETITLSTCDSADFDTKISVYTGSCDELTCVAGVDDAPGCGGNSTELFFPSEAGIPYLVLVHAYEDATGTFTLTATCTPTCSPIAANDACTNAEALPVEILDGCIPTVGSNECAFASAMPNPPCDPYDPIVDLWYSFNTGTQESITVFIAALGSGPLNAAVYEDCGTLDYIACETGLNGPWSINGLEPGMDLLLRVWNGGGPDAGNFAICIESDLPSGVERAGASSAALLWPNPALDKVQVSGVPEDTSVIQLLDLQGRVIRDLAVNGQRTIVFDVVDLDAGTYIIRTLGADPMPLGRFIKL